MESDFSIMPAASRSLQQPLARDLAIAVPTVSSDESNGRVLELFGKNRELISLPVLDHGRPMGLISRNIFMSQMSRPYHRELYEKKTCIAFMDKNPLIVDAATAIELVGALAVESGDKTLADGFIIVSGGQFTGLGSGLDLMRMLVDLQSEKNRQVMQSIEYASVIQRARLGTSQDAMAAALADACMVWEPRDMVGGDFYYFARHGDNWFAAMADCTGHGVPGAFLTLIATSALTQALSLYGPHDPAQLMGEVNRGMKQALGQHAGASRLSGSDDGMDAAFFWCDTAARTLTCANARMPVFVLNPDAGSGKDSDGIDIVEPERTGLGYVATPQDAVWRNRVLPLAAGTVVLVATDGLTDQIGGDKNIAYGKRRLREALYANRNLPMPALAAALMQDHHDYQGRHRRRDDLAFFGFRAV